MHPVGALGYSFADTCCQAECLFAVKQQFLMPYFISGCTMWWYKHLLCATALQAVI
jgi:hypothetical protein